MKLLKRLIDMVKRPPDVIIEGNYLHRWHIIPRNKWFNVYLHKFQDSDPDRGLHCHPWYSCSFLLKGETLEKHFNGYRHIPRFFPIKRSGKFAHRIIKVSGPIWTIFITGPKYREWGFYVDNDPNKWVHYEEYVINRDNKREENNNV